MCMNRHTGIMLCETIPVFIQDFLWGGRASILEGTERRDMSGGGDISESPFLYGIYNCEIYCIHL